MNKRINFKVLSIIGLILIALTFAYVNHPPIVSLWEGSGIYNDLKPNAQLPILAIQTGGDSEGFHGYGYGLLMISKNVADVFGYSLPVIKILPILYGLISAFLLYIICSRWYNWRVATIATALLLTNINFIYYQHSLRSQTLTLAAVLFCIERFQKLTKNDDLFTLITTGIACALGAMHYIVGRFAMLAILFFYLFDPMQYWNAGRLSLGGFLNRLKNLCIVLLSMTAVLTLLFPKNLLFLLNKTFLFSPLGEYSTETYSALFIVWHNLKYMVYYYVFNGLGGPPSDIMLNLPYPIDQKLVIALFLLGIAVALRSLKKLESRLLLFLTLFLTVINLFSTYVPGEEFVYSSKMLVTRLFLLLPFIAVLAALSIDYLYEKANKASRYLGWTVVLSVILFFAFRTGFYFAEAKRFDSYMAGFKYDFSKPAIAKQGDSVHRKGDMPPAMKREILYNQIYFYNLALYIAEKVKSGKRDDGLTKLIYVPSDYYTPDYYRYGGGNIPWKGYPYYFDLYLTFYLRDAGIKNGYLIKKSEYSNFIGRTFRVLRRNSKTRQILAKAKNTFVGKPVLSFLEDQGAKYPGRSLSNNYFIFNAGYGEPKYILVTDRKQLIEVEAQKNCRVIIALPPASKK